MSSGLHLPPLGSTNNLTTLDTKTSSLKNSSSGVLRNPRGKQRKNKKEYQKAQKGISFGPLEESNEDLEFGADLGNQPRCSVVQFGAKRRSSKVSEERRASRGSFIKASAILDNMKDPDELEINVNRKSLMKAEDPSNDFCMSAHDDLVNARKRVVKRGMCAGTTFDFVKSNLISNDQPEEGETLEGPQSTIAKPTGFASGLNPMRQSLFFNRKSIAEHMEKDMTENGTFRRDTMAIHKQQSSIQKKKTGGLGGLLGLGGGAPRHRKSFARKQRSHTVCERFEGSDEEIYDEEEGEKKKLSFYDLVKAIIRVKRWNVPLYLGNTKDEENEDCMSPLDFDLAKFKSDSWRSCPSKLKYLMTLTPWDRTDEDVDKIRNIVLQMKYFDRYSDAVKTELARVVRFESYGNGRIILQQGHPGFAMYFILSGGCSVQVLATDEQTGEHFHQIVNELNTGQIFGELALMNDITRTATIVCRMDSEFLRIDREDFDNVLRRAIEIEWNDRMTEMQKIPYFKSWPQSEINEMNPHSQIKHFKINTVMMGDKKSGDMSEYVYFLVKGRCNIVRRITLLETSKVIGKYDSCKRVTKYKRIPNGDINKYLNYDKNTKQWKTKHEGKLSTTIGAKGTISVAANFFAKHLNSELQPNTLLKRQQNTKTLVKTRATKHNKRKVINKFSLESDDLENISEESTNTSFTQNMKPNGEFEDEIVDEFIENGEQSRIIYKYLVVNRLERGDSFGFGEDLTNIFIVTASQIDCLIIPSHIMMRAERHVETINRKSQQQSVEQMTNQMRRRQSLAVGYEQYSAKKKTPAPQQQAPTHTRISENGDNGKTSDTHHYVELRQMIEDKIPGERLSYERWRLNEDWNSYKAHTLQEVINNKIKK